MFKDDMVVKIKDEWCDSELDKQMFWITKNVNEKTKRCDICLIAPERYGLPLGLIQTVSFDMIYKCALPKYRFKITYQVGKVIREKVVEATHETEARKKVKVSNIINVVQIQ